MRNIFQNKSVVHIILLMITLTKQKNGRIKAMYSM